MFFQSNAVLKVGEKQLLIDAGGDIRRSLAAADITLLLTSMVFTSRIRTRSTGRCCIWLTVAISMPNLSILMGVSVGSSFCSRRRSSWALEWVGWNVVLAHKAAELTDFFDVVAFDGVEFDWEGIRFTTAKVTHCMDNGAPMPVYGLTWKFQSGLTVWFSADATFDRTQPLFATADVIFHDCETAAIATGVHAHYKELLTLPDSVRSKVTLYHYSDGVKPDCKAHGFAGWAGQSVSISRSEK